MEENTEESMVSFTEEGAAENREESRTEVPEEGAAENREESRTEVPEEGAAENREESRTEVPEEGAAENRTNLHAAIEAVLFAMGEPIEPEHLAAALGISREETETTIQEMTERYEQEDRGIRIIVLEGAYQLCTKKEYTEYLIRLAMHPKKPVLTDVMLETLSIIAYRQPVTKAEIDKIRGVKSDHAVNRLIEFNLVRELGRLDAPGRPILFGTTQEFLRCFGVEGTDELPEIDPVRMEDFKAEAEQEAAARLVPITT